MTAFPVQLASIDGEVAAFRMYISYLYVPKVQMQTFDDILPYLCLELTTVQHRGQNHQSKANIRSSIRMSRAMARMVPSDCSGDTDTECLKM